MDPPDHSSQVRSRRKFFTGKVHRESACNDSFAFTHGHKTNRPSVSTRKYEKQPSKQRYGYANTSPP